MTYFSISRTKRGVCPVCGKEAQRQITFYGSEYEGTPNADGSARTVRQLEAELEAKAASALWHASTPTELDPVAAAGWPWKEDR